MSNESWILRNAEFKPENLLQFNSVFAVSNGYLSFKGNLAEDRSGAGPVTIINGVYDELDMFGQLRASGSGRPWLNPARFDSAGKSPGVANLPSPLLTRVYVGDCEVALELGEVSGFRQELDLRSGLYSYEFKYRDSAGRTTRIEMERFASLKYPHRAYMRYRVTPVDHEAAIRIESGIDGRVHSSATRERQFEILDRSAEACGCCRMNVRTPARGIDVRMAVNETCNWQMPEAKVVGVVEHDAAYVAYEFATQPNVPIEINRAIVLACSEDRRHGCECNFEREIEAAGSVSFNVALAENQAEWDRLWRGSDVMIEGDSRSQLYLRFCIFHLLAAAPRFSDRLNVPVKLLTGDYYQGNTFYDTDVYIEPFYMFTQPEYARTCLNHRYYGLEQGRRTAGAQGYRGAKLAWQAGPYGEECLGPWYHFVHTNIHINADVAHSLMQYAWATGDTAFMRSAGVEMLVEFARFYASRAEYDADRDAYDIHDVSGPDEGHCHSTNNFYTNYLAGQTMRWAADELEALQKRDSDAAANLLKRLKIEEAEPDNWRGVAERLTLLFDPESKVYQQYDGLFDLPEPPADLLDRRDDWFIPLCRYRALNQPDVLMTMALLPEDFDDEVRAANWRLYKDMSLNFSSMSFVINSIIAAQLGEMDEAYENFVISAGMDLDESLTGRRDTYAGLHGTAMGGAWMAAVFGFGGVNLSERGLSFKPRLPEQWKSLRFNLALRGVSITVRIEKNSIELCVDDEGNVDLPVNVAGQAMMLKAGETYLVSY